MKVLEIRASLLEKDPATDNHTKHVSVVITDVTACAAFADLLTHLGADLDKTPDAGKIEITALPKQKTA